MAYTKVSQVRDSAGMVYREECPGYKVECDKCGTVWWRQTHPMAVHKAFIHATMEKAKDWDRTERWHGR